MKHIFLDLETTGLEAGLDMITEAAWVLEDGTERQYFVEHFRLPSRWVLENTDYVTRILPARKVSLAVVRTQLAIDCAQGPTYLVGACPAFDDRFLRVRWNPPYHYHVIDVEAAAMGALGHDAPMSLKDLRAALGIPGENEAAHTALADAREVKLIWDALRARRAA